MSQLLGRISLGLVIALAAGCTAQTGTAQIDPKGPYPAVEAGAVNYAPFGQLSVALVPTPAPVGQWQLYWIPPGYSVYRDDGRLLQSVQHDPITLPEGKYLVQLDEPNSQPSTFWVEVSSGLLTQVDLNKPLQLWVVPEAPPPPGAKE